jgi:hypothetical protein
MAPCGSVRSWYDIHLPLHSVRRKGLCCLYRTSKHSQLRSRWTSVRCFEFVLVTALCSFGMRVRMRSSDLRKLLSYKLFDHYSPQINTFNRLATPWKRKTTPPYTALSSVTVAGMAHWLRGSMLMVGTYGII